MRRTVAAIALVGCAPTVIPPRTVPEPRPPPESPRPLPPGPNQGQISIATTDDAPTLVQEPTGVVEGVAADGTSVTGVAYSTVCAATPCVANLSFGTHALRFTSLYDGHDHGDAEITVGQTPAAFRYALGHDTEATPGRGILALALGLGAVTMGLTLVGIGKQTSLPMSCVEEGPGCMGGTTNYTTAGAITAIVGVALSALGTYWLTTRVGTSQDGAGVQWTPE